LEKVLSWPLLKRLVGKDKVKRRGGI